jgi:hypothetical protein
MDSNNDKEQARSVHKDPYTNNLKQITGYLGLPGNNKGKSPQNGYHASFRMQREDMPVDGAAGGGSANNSAKGGNEQRPLNDLKQRVPRSPP